MRGVGSANRRAPRIHVQLPMLFAALDEAETESADGAARAPELAICTNLSAGGALLTACLAFAPGRRVCLELELPGAVMLHGLARVAWSRTTWTSPLLSSETAARRPPECRMGLHFLHLGDERARGWLQQFVVREAGRRERRVIGIARRYMPRSPRYA